VQSRRAGLVWLGLAAALALAGCSGGAPGTSAHQAVDPARQFDLQCTDVLRRIGRRFTFTIDLTTGQWRDSTGTMHRIVSTAGNSVVLSESPDGTRPTINLQTNTLLMGGTQPTTVAATCRRAPFTPFDDVR
jgi:hypothetical protein